jgi:hypothetical protein
MKWVANYGPDYVSCVSCKITQKRPSLDNDRLLFSVGG